MTHIYSKYVHTANNNYELYFHVASNFTTGYGIMDWRKWKIYDCTRIKYMRAVCNMGLRTYALNQNISYFFKQKLCLTNILSKRCLGRAKYLWSTSNRFK